MRLPLFLILGWAFGSFVNIWVEIRLEFQPLKVMFHLGSQLTKLKLLTKTYIHPISSSYTSYKE